MINKTFFQGSSETKEQVKVYKWDGTAVKNALDDAVKDVMTTKLPYTENFGLKVYKMDILAIDNFNCVTGWKTGYLRHCCWCCDVCPGVGLFLQFPSVPPSPDWLRDHLLHPDGHPHPVHHLQGEGHLRGGDAEGSRRHGPRLYLGGRLQYEEV